MPPVTVCGVVVALVGAESTGKSTLSFALARALTARGHRVAVVDETLRSFCDREGRTPRRDEQRALADAQTRRIETAARDHDIVVADTTALMTAVYSDRVFGDTSLYADAEARQRRCRITLLTALDLPWQADGLQRDGPHVREPIDALIRAALARAGCAFAVVGGAGGARLASALAAVDRALAAPAWPPATRWQAHCERCGDPDCERRLLPRPA